MWGDAYSECGDVVYSAHEGNDGSICDNGNDKGSDSKVGDVYGGDEVCENNKSIEGIGDTKSTNGMRFIKYELLPTLREIMIKNEC